MSGRDARPPLLRAPPFPWVSPAVAAVSTARTGKAGDVDPRRLEATIAAVGAARVGGSFWATPARPIAAGSLILRARDPGELERAEARCAALGVAPALRCLPDEPWSHARGDGSLLGAVDPWSLLAPGIRLIASADDEWRSIAVIAGADVIDADAAALQLDLGRRLFEDAAYRDCFTGADATAGQAIEILASWRRIGDANRGIAAASGMAWWKKQAIERFLWADRDAALRMTDDPVEAVAAARPDRAIAVWPSRMPDGLSGQAAQAGVPIVAVEDGFIRSTGLGSDLHVPRSIVVDRSGIYYDPARASDLETILATTDFSPALLARAAALRHAIVARGISKYATDAAAPRTVRPAGDIRTVLVAGQVEDDMSVRAGGGGIGGNLALLRRARADEPDARILFRPHPDVDAGHRVGRIPDGQALTLADAIVRTESMAALLARVDAVHVLTSQTGFEALLRGVETIVHGQPFYAGWGLTTDLAGPLPRRGRALPIDALVAGTLILYPLYWDPETDLPCPPEILLDRLAARQRPRLTPLIAARRLQGRIARMFNRVTG